MSFMKNTAAKHRSAEHGSASVFAAIVMSGIIVLNAVLYDYTSFLYQKDVNGKRLRLACSSVLSNYDSLLAEKYGLYGYNTSSGESAEYDFSKYYTPFKYGVSVSGAFTEPDIIKRGITGTMKLRTPVNITETIVKVLGFLSDSAEMSGDYGICAKAAEKLSGLQNKHIRLKYVTEGHFQNDFACVNGYSETLNAALAAEILSQADAASAIDKLLGLNKQYLEYNYEAARLCGELESGRNEIADILSGISSSSEAYDEALNILAQAGKIENAAAARRINANIGTFTERIKMLDKLKSGEAVYPEAFTEAFIYNKIDTDIKVNVIYAESGGEGRDERIGLSEEILKLSQKSSSQDKYVIPETDYMTFPSVRKGLAGKAEENIFTAALDSFGDFTDIIGAAGGMSFREAAMGAADTVLIDDYILTYMTDRLCGKSDSKINNEVEYIIGGDRSSNANNKNVENKIITIRFIVNFINIIKDAERSAEAEAAARAAAALISMGAGVAIYKYIIIAGWALVDSYNDRDRLLSGENVPIISFTGNAGKKLNELQNYSFYTRIILMLMPQETKLMRICDIIEINMKELTGAAYKLSGVYSKVHAKITVRPELVFIPEIFGRELYWYDECEMSY